MPHLDGRETYGELRRVRENVRVVMMSGFNEQEVVSHFAGKGLVGFLQKPFLYETLGETLRQALVK